MTAGHGDGTCHQADERVLSQHCRQQHADGVLHDDEHADDNGEIDQRFTARFQAGKIGTEPDRGEKDEHEGILQPGIKFEDVAAEAIEDIDNGRRDQTARDRFGDVEVTQETDFSH